VREGIPQVSHPRRPDRQRSTRSAGAGFGALQTQIQFTLTGGHPLPRDRLQHLQLGIVVRRPRCSMSRAPRREECTICTAAHPTPGDLRDGAQVAELTGLLHLSGWPPGMRVIVRRERPHPGAQLSLFEERDGWRYTAFVTNTRSAPFSGWRCGTAPTPEWRTGSAAPRTPACACRSARALRIP
jgi:hypothetical protein